MNVIQQFTKYLKDAYVELKKVVWPTRRQTRNYTIVVILMSLGVALFFSVLDNVFNFILEKII